MIDVQSIAWLDESACLDPRVAGGKGASLARMTATGLNVPPGFVVHAGTLERSVDAEALVAHAREGDHARAQDLVRGAEPPWRELSEAYARLGGLVAVRSSACAEDSDEASFAGQQETFLGVEGSAAVGDRVVECWASFFSERALFYRRLKGSLDDLSMAVVVQRMVAAEKAGVLFTVDPISRRSDRMLVEAVFGLGEQVVSGTVTPDHYLVDLAGGVRSERLLHGGVLEPSELEALALLGQRLADELGGPQDIEWAIADGAIHLLQSRPITTL